MGFALPVPAGGAAETATAAAAAPPGGRPKLVGTAVSMNGETGVDQPRSTCEIMGGDTATQVGSFRLPETMCSAGGGAELLVGPEGAGEGTGGRAGSGEGGDDVEVGSEAGLTVVTAAETPAACASALAARAGWGSGGEAAGGRAAVEQSDGGAGGGRGGCMLDAYREPEGNDWGELEDWQGLPGLQLAGGGGGGRAAARLQVTTRWSTFLFHTSAIFRRYFDFFVPV